MQLLGGDLFATAFIPFTNANVSGTLETPPGNFFRKESEGGYTDMSLAGGLGWHTETCHWNAVATVYMPTGNFERGALAYTGLGYWTVEPAVGFTYLNTKNGRQIALFAAVDFYVTAFRRRGSPQPASLTEEQSTHARAPLPACPAVPVVNRMARVKRTPGHRKRIRHYHWH